MFTNDLKGHCHEIFLPFFCLIDSTWAPHEQAKIISRTFFVFCKDICKKRVSALSTIIGRLAFIFKKYKFNFEFYFLKKKKIKRAPAQFKLKKNEFPLGLRRSQ